MPRVQFVKVTSINRLGWMGLQILWILYYLYIDEFPASSKVESCSSRGYGKIPWANTTKILDRFSPTLCVKKITAVILNGGLGCHHVSMKRQLRIVERMTARCDLNPMR